VEFRLQPDPVTLPVESNAVDTIVLSFVLHHVEAADLERLLSEIRRVLKPAGKAVILEDTYSALTRPGEESGYQELFLKLDEQQKIKALAFNDWLGNAVFRGLPIGLPYNFRSMEDWQACFAAAGFLAPVQRSVGMLAESIHFAPFGVFVLEKPRDPIARIVPLDPLDGGAVNKDVAGIDFRALPAGQTPSGMPGALPANLAPDAGLATRILARLGKSASASQPVDPVQEWLGIEQDINAGTIPAVSSMEGYVKACCQSERIAAERNKVLLALAAILRLQEALYIPT